MALNNAGVTSHKTEARTVELDVFGQRFSVRSDNTDARIAEIVAVVDARLGAIQKSAGTLPADRIALLGALTLAEELVALQEENALLKEAVRDRAGQLMGALDELQELHNPNEACLS